MSAWATALLGEVASVFNGKTPSRADQRATGHPVLKIKDVNELGEYRGRFESFVDAELAARLAEKQVRNGDTLILNAAHRANFVASKTYRAQPPTWGALATGEWIIVRPDQQKLHAGFANHWINSAHTRRALRELVHGLHLYPKDVARLRVPLPPLEEQHRIAEALDVSQRLQSQRRAALTLLDTLLSAVFLELFGEPIGNPRAWPVYTLGELAREKPGNGIFRKNPEYLPAGAGGVPVVWVEELFRGRSISTTDSRRLSASAAEVEKYGLHHGDLLFCRSSLKREGIAFSNVYLGEERAALFECHVIRLSPRLERVSPVFLNAQLRLPQLRAVAQSKAKTATMTTMDQPSLCSIPVVVPPLELQREFVRRASAVEKLRAVQQASLAEMDTLFASLHHRLLKQPGALS